ncbi:T4-like virus tail tube protein gp19-domain-containing protein [Linnemannia elongata]|nr:T4-like virus tail tube protein gp19-domain-containing protein [Linnemannia elongata]
MPSQADDINITLKKGVFVGQSKLYDWISSISGDQVEKKDITISLTNESGSEVLIKWNVINAFPTSLTAPNLNADSNEVTIEELSLLAMRVSVRFTGS